MRARIERENGCEACWEAARAAGVVSVGESVVDAPSSWVGKRCRHGAGTAPSILVLEEEEEEVSGTGARVSAVRSLGTARRGGRMGVVLEREGNRVLVRWPDADAWTLVECLDELVTGTCACDSQRLAASGHEPGCSWAEEKAAERRRVREAKVRELVRRALP